MLKTYAYQDYSYFYTDLSKTVLPVRFVFVMLYSFVCSWQPCDHMLRKGRHLDYCVWRFLAYLSLSHMVSRARCGIWLYQFQIFAFFLTFIKFQYKLYVYTWGIWVVQYMFQTADLLFFNCGPLFLFWNVHFSLQWYKTNLSYDITPCNKVDKPLVAYRFTGNVMTSITTLHT